MRDTSNVLNNMILAKYDLGPDARLSSKLPLAFLLGAVIKTL